MKNHPCQSVLRAAPLLVATALLAAASPAAAQPSPLTSFFVTSAGNGAAGGNYGGLAGADARCQALADVAGVGTGRTWRAYLSTAPIAELGGALVHARDRIGSGPWYNYAGEQVAANVTALHADGIHPSRMLTETGVTVPSNEHDILTGSEADGTAIESFPGNPSAPAPTCFNWTSNDPDVYGWVGHEDWIEGQSWVFQHEVFCDQAGLASTAGSGRLYCFAIATNLVFADGFESNDTSEWSAAVP